MSISFAQVTLVTEEFGLINGANTISLFSVKEGELTLSNNDSVIFDIFLNPSNHTTIKGKDAIVLQDSADNSLALFLRSGDNIILALDASSPVNTFIYGGEGTGIHIDNSDTFDPSTTFAVGFVINDRETLVVKDGLLQMSVTEFSNSMIIRGSGEIVLEDGVNTTMANFTPTSTTFPFLGITDGTLDISIMSNTERELKFETGNFLNWKANQGGFETMSLIVGFDTRLQIQEGDNIILASRTVTLRNETFDEYATFENGIFKVS